MADKHLDTALVNAGRRKKYTPPAIGPTASCSTVVAAP